MYSKHTYSFHRSRPHLLIQRLEVKSDSKDAKEQQQLRDIVVNKGDDLSKNKHFTLKLTRTSNNVQYKYDQQ